MFGIHDLTLFIISRLLLNIMPGPDSLLIMTRSATQGWRAGSAATLGIGAGAMVHISAAALGLSAHLQLQGMVWSNGLAVFTAFASARRQLKPLVSLWLNRVTGGLFLALGLRLALAEQH